MEYLIYKTNFYLGRGIPIKFKDLKINGEAQTVSYIKNEERVAALSQND